MTFTELIWFMVSMVKASSHNARERFFPRIGKADVSMSQQAFSAARQKIKGEAFEELFRASVEGSYHEEWKRRRGFRLMAIDRSCIRLPSDPERLKYYGVLGPEGKTAAALASMRYDRENDSMVDANLVLVRGNERDLAVEHRETLRGLESYQRGKELLVFDRGYPSQEFIQLLQDREIAYVMRVQQGFVREGATRGKGKAG